MAAMKGDLSNDESFSTVFVFIFLKETHAVEILTTCYFNANLNIQFLFGGVFEGILQNFGETAGIELRISKRNDEFYNSHIKSKLVY